MYVSIAIFILTVCTGGWSLYVAINLYSDAWSPHCAQGGVALEYVSTRIAHCLDTRQAEMWSLVYCIEVQILLLLSQWRRLFASYHFVTNLRECAISCGVWFIISFGMVVEFRNDRMALTEEFLFFPAIPESTLHSYAAVNAMLALTVLHALLCSSLLSLSTQERRIARAAMLTRSASLKTVPVIDFDFRGAVSEHEDAMPVYAPTDASSDAYSHWGVFKRLVYDYAILDWIYLCCVVIFFVSWASASNSNSAVVYATSVHTEWLVLLLGALMQAYALWQSERPLSWCPETPANLFISVAQNLRNCNTSWRVVMTSVSYVAALLYSLIILCIAPLGKNGDLMHARSSGMLLWTIVTAYAYGALLLLS